MIQPIENHDLESRRKILDRLESHHVDGPALPELDPESFIQFDDAITQFTQSAQLVGAAVHRVAQYRDVQPVLEQFEAFQNAQRIASLVPESMAGNLDMSTVEDPHYLKGLDWLLARGEFGVAENGAIWMTMDGVTHRACFFLTQFLAVVIPASEIVMNMHQAYERLGQRVSQPFGLFLSGPSKTADIEQSLVLGAHGCRELNVFIVE